MYKKMVFAVCFVAGTLIMSCKNNENKSDAVSTDTTTVASDSTSKTVYACPMDPEITSDQPAQCSKCGMDLVIKNQ